MILDRIVSDVRHGLAQRREISPLEELKRQIDKCETPRDFEGALQEKGIGFIAEVKRASPSKGWLCPDLDVATIVSSYTKGGAAAVSVLTEPNWFKGDLADLTTARKATHLPLLYKGFILDSYQVYEARTHGADAILLIASLLSISELSVLIEVAREMGMTSLVEVHNEPELKKALDARGSLIGINNRNLADFSVDLGTTLKLRPLIPSGIIVVSESGIKSRADIVALEDASVDAVLIGETLVTSTDPEAALKGLRGFNGQG
ncbi:indole-3-glycerol phosphate synthase TrpC [Chloroflexota bacterium]